jgi:hypothetical protein
MNEQDRRYAEYAEQIAEEFEPLPPRTLETCYTLRRAGYVPYATLLFYGRQLECISYPFMQDGIAIKGGGCGIGIMMREPNDPTTLFEWSIPRRVVRMAIESFGK